MFLIIAALFLGNSTQATRNSEALNEIVAAYSYCVEEVRKASAQLARRHKDFSISFGEIPYNAVLDGKSLRQALDLSKESFPSVEGPGFTIKKTEEHLEDSPKLVSAYYYCGSSQCTPLSASDLERYYRYILEYHFLNFIKVAKKKYAVSNAGEILSRCRRAVKIATKHNPIRDTQFDRYMYARELMVNWKAKGDLIQTSTGGK